jgi:trimethylamine--corrinoid protein Co-methyltransferase
MKAIKPQVTLFGPQEIDQVHRYSLEILSSTGVRVDSARARALFSEAGGRPAGGDRMTLPAELIEWALGTAPATVEVYTRLGELAFSLGGDGEARFGTGVTALNYQEPATEAVVPFARQHMAIATRLADRLSDFDVISTAGIPHDVSPEQLDLIATLEMVANAHKPLVVLVSDHERFSAVLDLLEHLHGDLAAQPFVIPYFNPITPLVLNGGTVDKMFVAIERGLPFIFSNYGMAGASTPITPAGSLALLNAELLAGLALSQLVREGAPVILGSLPASFDMRGAGSFYSMSGYLLNMACAEMMAHYRIPHAGTSGSGMGWGMDLVSGGHQWVNHLLACISKAELSPFVGDTLGSMVFSPTTVVYANDVIAQVRRLAQGFCLDDAAVDLEEIRRVGPGGDFLISESTLKLHRDAYFKSAVFPRLSMDRWQTAGHPRAEDKLRAYTCELIDQLAPPENHDDLISRGEAFIRQIGGRQ